MNGASWAARAVTLLAVVFKGAWYIECDHCGDVLKGGRKNRRFVTRDAADQAGRAAGWQVAGGDDDDAELCPDCLTAKPGSLDPLTYRTELSRSTSGQWSLHRDARFIARTRRNDMDPAAAREWASATLGRRDMEWLNGRYGPDDESGYRVADPQDSAGGAPALAVANAPAVIWIPVAGIAAALVTIGAGVAVDSAPVMLAGAAAGFLALAALVAAWRRGGRS